MSKIVFAIGAYPGDIESMMGGTILLLQQAGCEVHFMNMANGCCGSNRSGYEENIRIYQHEAMKAASLAGAVYHKSMVDDLNVTYSQDLIEKMTSLIREIKPDIILTHGPYGNSEDNVNTSRVVVTSALARSMINAECNPFVPIDNHDVAIYHSVPLDTCDQYCNAVCPEINVDISSVITQKNKILEQYKSQNLWLAMNGCRFSGTEEISCEDMLESHERWIRHKHHGLCECSDNPLVDILKRKVILGSGNSLDSSKYEEAVTC
tara:strand:+ start:199 stop:990 length:792 start_codon:yes stop_codon:yes gene_type:complete